VARRGRELVTSNASNKQRLSRPKAISIDRHKGIMNTFKIAVIAGDRIGKEVVPEGIRILDAATMSVYQRLRTFY
jgi:isocitrate dehydrogenase